MTTRRVALASAVAVMLLCGCPESVTAVPGSIPTLVKTTKEPAGTHCAAGGVAIMTGPDADKDGTLQDTEATATSYVCNGATTLVTVESEPAGANCGLGGTAISTGVDKNGDGALGTGEVTSTQYVCNAAGAAAGDGGTGLTSLVRQDAEARGANCANGGTAIRTGLDQNRNGTLDNDEISQLTYLCNAGLADGGTPGGLKSLIAQQTVAPGVQCPTGGVSISAGLDSNGNDALEAGEISSTSVVCNGGTTSDGGILKQALVSAAAEPAGANCPSGGTVFRTGLDTNGDGSLQPSEYLGTSYACSGSGTATGFSTGPALSYASGTGEVPTGVYYPVLPEIFYTKTDPTSRLKITLNTTSRGNIPSAGAGSEQYLVVRVNGWELSPACYVDQYVHIGGATHDYHLPLSNVCLTDQLAAGTYHFDVWMYSSAGTGYVHWASYGVLLIEEVPASANVAFVRSINPGLASGEIGSGTFQNLPQRSVSHTKQSASTLLKVTVADTMRVSSAVPGSGELAVFVDGVQQPACTRSQYAQSGTTTNIHHPFVMECVLTGVSAAPHLFDVRARSGYNGTPAGDTTYIGRNRGNSLLLIEELSATGNRTYSSVNSPQTGPVSVLNTTGTAAQYWASFVPVPGPGRTISHTPAAGKKVKLTYSDSFRNLVPSPNTCGTAYGCYALFVDGANYQQRCVYTANSGEYSNLILPVHETWLIPGLSSAAHTFEIRTAVQGSCNQTYFGWANTRTLLMAEDL